jgi:hypothetical protein
MRPAPDFEWSLSGEPYRIRFSPHFARFEVCIEGDWVRLFVCHRPAPEAPFATAGLPSFFRRQLVAALELRQQHAKETGLSKSSRRRRPRKAAAWVGAR